MEWKRHTHILVLNTILLAHRIELKCNLYQFTVHTHRRRLSPSKWDFRHFYRQNRDCFVSACIAEKVQIVSFVHFARCSRDTRCTTKCYLVLWRWCASNRWQSAHMSQIIIFYEVQTSFTLSKYQIENLRTIPIRFETIAPAESLIVIVVVPAITSSSQQKQYKQHRKLFYRTFEWFMHAASSQQQTNKKKNASLQRSTPYRVSLSALFAISKTLKVKTKVVWLWRDWKLSDRYVSFLMKLIHTLFTRRRKKENSFAWIDR